MKETANTKLMLVKRRCLIISVIFTEFQFLSIETQLYNVVDTGWFQIILVCVKLFKQEHHSLAVSASCQGLLLPLPNPYTVLWKSCSQSEGTGHQLHLGTWQKYNFSSPSHSHTESETLWVDPSNLHFNKPSVEVILMKTNIWGPLVKCFSILILH